MNNPIVAYLGGVDLKPITKIQLNNGVVDGPVLADTDSAETVFFIANNFTKGAAVDTDCYDMKNCTVTVKAVDGTMDTEQVVKEKWINVKCLSNP